MFRIEVLKKRQILQFLFCLEMISQNKCSPKMCSHIHEKITMPPVLLEIKKNREKSIGEAFKEKPQPKNIQMKWKEEI